MSGYIPPYEITDKILTLVASVSEKIGQITAKNELEARPHLRRNNKIRSIYSSLQIEANSLSLDEVKDVIDGHLVLGKEKEIQEVKNAYAAYEEIPDIDPYKISELKRIHGIMTKYLIDGSGAFRKKEEGVFDGETCIFMAPPARFVPGLMQDLFDWMKTYQEQVHPLIMSAVFHYEFVFIHPFEDGNGRMARLWHTTLLSKWKPVFEFIPLESQIEKFQSGYYETIAACHKDGKSTRFIEFILEQLDMVLDEMNRKTAKKEKSISKYVEKLMKVMEYDVPYTSNELLELLSLKSKDSLRKNYLKPSLDHDLIQMTEPDKPKSKNQRYVKVL